jgi:hypothetical protein
MYIFPGQTLEFESVPNDENDMCRKQDNVQILLTFVNIVKFSFLEFS